MYASFVVHSLLECPMRCVTRDNFFFARMLAPHRFVTAAASFRALLFAHCLRCVAPYGYMNAIEGVIIGPGSLRYARSPSNCPLPQRFAELASSTACVCLSPSELRLVVLLSWAFVNFREAFCLACFHSQQRRGPCAHSKVCAAVC